jgi:mRNA interferase RelE/StbE
MNRKTSEDKKILDESTGYELLERPRARRQLNRLRTTHHPLIKAIVEAIRNLATTPRPPRAEKLVGHADWRIRVGDYRVLYLIDDGNRRITITKVAHRRDVYR